MKQRIYLDYNATAPLRPEVRAAMVAAMDAVGNPSSVHQEGRAAKAIVEKARRQVAQSFGADGADIVFTSGATEAAALALSQKGFVASDIEHDAVRQNAQCALGVSAQGHVDVIEPEQTALQYANSETGVVQSLPKGIAFCDATQGYGKLPIAFNWMGAQMAAISAHKIGGPAGIGALVMQRGTDIAAQIKGGGQEGGRRSGTENIIGLAGFGAAAEAAQRDLNDGVWDRIKEFRIILENSLEQEVPEVILVSKNVERLPNTVMCIVDGWKGETQVMQMDLAGFAISAGSACSSGKVRQSNVLRAMGYSESQAACAIRVSLGPQTHRDEIDRFVEAYAAAYRKQKSRSQ